MGSEFGRGFTYCIGLFLAHAERKIIFNDYSLWFNAAADHLYELQIPNNISDEFKSKIESWQDKCIEWRIAAEVTKENFEWALNTAKEILFQYDNLCNIETIKAEYE